MVVEQECHENCSRLQNDTKSVLRFVIRFVGSSVQTIAKGHTRSFVLSSACFVRVMYNSVKDIFTKM